MSPSSGRLVFCEAPVPVGPEQTSKQNKQTRQPILQDKDKT